MVLTVTDSNTDKCIPCVRGKMTRGPFPASDSRADTKLALIHMDLCGPIEVQSFGGARYIYLLTDDYSRKKFVLFLKKKEEAFEKFKEFKVRVEKESGERNESGQITEVNS